MGIVVQKKLVCIPAGRLGIVTSVSSPLRCLGISVEGAPGDLQCLEDPEGSHGPWGSMCPYALAEYGRLLVRFQAERKLPREVGQFSWESTSTRPWPVT